MRRVWAPHVTARRGPRPACGIQIAEHVMRAVGCDAGGAVATLAQVDLSTPTAEGYAQAFRALRLSAPGLAREAVCCGPPGWIDALPLRLPGTGDLEELLVEQARAHLSYALDDAVLDYLGPEPRDDGTRRALLVALPRKRAMEVLAAAAHGGFRVRALETPGVGLQRLLRHAARLDARRALVVHLEREHWIFLVLDAGSLHVERSLAWGEARLESAVAEQLDLPLGAAARLVRAADGSRDEAGSPVAEAALEIVSPFLRELTTEVERVLGYCRAEFRGAGVDRVLLSGAVSEVPCVRDVLRRLAPEAEEALPRAARQSEHAVAHGLALRFLEETCASST
jgi:hypothetical protein